MAQDDLVVVGIDVAKDKVDACIRWFKLRQTFPNNPQGRLKLIAWLRKYQVGKAVVEASGGYEREWRDVLRNPTWRCGLSIPGGSAILRVGRTLAKNDPIDAEMIASFAERLAKHRARLPMPRVRSFGADESAQGSDDVKIDCKLRTSMRPRNRLTRPMRAS